METKKAIELALADRSQPLKIADIGCGTGAATLLLAKELNANITAVDLFPEFLEVLQKNAERQGLADRISTLACSMDSLPFSAEDYDVIWSEGAIYNMGFAAGVAYWKRFLKPDGMLVVSELTWLTGSRPPELQAHWEKEYPEVATASSKIAVLEHHGFTPEAYFVLPEHCWIENYYRPMQDYFTDFLEQHDHSDSVRALVKAEEDEIAMFNQYHNYYSYGFYIARKKAA